MELQSQMTKEAMKMQKSIAKMAMEMRWPINWFW
jgi:hypothetical protein